MQNNLIKILVITLGVFVGVCQASEQLVKESDRSDRKYIDRVRYDTGIDLASLDDCVDPEPLQVNRPFNQSAAIGVERLKEIESSSHDLVGLDDSDRTEERLRVNKPSDELYAYYRALEVRLRKYWLDSMVKAADSPTPENIQKHLEITEVLLSASSDVDKSVEVKK